MPNSMTTQPDGKTVIVGVDTHKHVHVAVAIDTCGIRLGDQAFVADSGGYQRWTPSTGQLIDVAKWNLLRDIPVKMRGAEDDTEETAKPFASL